MGCALQVGGRGEVAQEPLDARSRSRHGETLSGKSETQAKQTQRFTRALATPEGSEEVAGEGLLEAALLAALRVQDEMKKDELLEKI